MSMQWQRFSNPVSYVDEHARNELDIYMTSDKRFSPEGSGFGRGVAERLAKRKDRGTYDSSKSWKAWMPVVDAAAKTYTKEHGSPGQKYHEIFSAATRRAVAHDWANWFDTEFAIRPADFRSKAERRRRGEPSF